MRHHVVITAQLLVAFCLSAQTSPSPVAGAPSTPSTHGTLQSTSTLVFVPTLVRTHEGSLVPSLEAHDFQLFDNDTRQSVTLEDSSHQPLAIVVLLQIGGAAREELPNYAGLTTMLSTIVGSAAHRVSLVTFDSQPEELWDFTAKTEALADGFLHPGPGDDGAAILDAVSFGIDRLKTQPPSARRVLLLLSQRQDSGSHTKVAEAVRSLGVNNVTIYSLSFSPEKDWLKDQFTKPRHGQPPYQLGPAGPTVIGTFDLGTPLKVALNALRQNAAAELASLSGGESFSFSNRSSLEQKLATVANNIPNRYLLSFQPSSPEPGFHGLKVRLEDFPDLDVSARAGYWSEARP